MGAAFWPVGGFAACRAWHNAPNRGAPDFRRRRAAQCRRERGSCVLFALGALGMLGTAAYGLAHGQHGQRSSLERRFQGRAQLGAALVGSLFSASRPGPAGAGRTALRRQDRQGCARPPGGGGRIELHRDHRRQRPCPGGQLGRPVGPRERSSSGPMFLRRALTSNSYGLSGDHARGLRLHGAALQGQGRRHARPGHRHQGELLGAFLGGTLKQVSNNAASTLADRRRPGRRDLGAGPR